MSSILSTSACGVGTHTTSFPSWPTSGWYGCFAGCACANAQPIINAKNSDNKDRPTRRDSFMFVLLMIKSNQTYLKFGSRKVAKDAKVRRNKLSIFLCALGVLRDNISRQFTPEHKV